uniref:sodium-dependent glucose transporter 1C-like isoform X1 n=1 Tax=Styela clava TaxID=7725 RepID=UPI00193A9AF6|nr:sodium-dependent glucose transporter 1C-like isoform X1 [Styela clava]
MARQNKLVGLMLTLSISIIRIGMGYFISVAGPILLHLADNVGVSVGTVSYIFVGGSIGVVIGSIFGAVMRRRMNPKFRHLYTFGFAAFLLGTTSPVVPFIKSLWLLFLIYLIGGIVYGYLDAGLQALILKLWNEKSSRSHIQLFNFTYSIGAFAAPLIAKQMQEMYGDIPSTAASKCQHQKIENSSLASRPYLNSTVDNTSMIEVDDRGLRWTYYTLAIWMLPVSILMMFLAYNDVEEKILRFNREKSSNSGSTIVRDDPFKDVVFILIAVAGYYFCSVGMETVFYSFIYSVTFCSDLGFTPAQASYANSLVWLGLGIGRLSGVVFAKRVQPRTIVFCCIAGTTIDSFIMSVFGEQTALVTWIVAFTHGLTTSTLYPAGVSWLSQVTNVSGAYMFIFNLGSALGSLTMLPLAGHLFDKNPFNAIHLVLALSVSNGVFFALALLAARFFKRKVQKKALEMTNQVKTSTENDFMMPRDRD